MSEPKLPLISVIVPFHNAAGQLEACLNAIASSDYPNYEVIPVDDGSTDSSCQIAQGHKLEVLSLGEVHGPAYARNRGAEKARGAILFFVDADVLCYSDTLSKVGQTLTENPGLDAVIGSYDDDPPATNFFSRYKNLTHHFVHQTASLDASTFWTGCGAIRRKTFLEFHGFDESFRRPSIEDIELGYRLRARGRKILLRKDLVVKHSKVWSFRGMLRSDFFDRALPWTCLQLRYGRILNDLNVGSTQRAAALFICAAALAIGLTFWNVWFLVLATVLILPPIVMNRNLYRFHLQKGGLWFALRSTAVHWLYYVYSAIAFVAGYARYEVSRLRSHCFGTTNNGRKTDGCEMK